MIMNPFLFTNPVCCWRRCHCRCAMPHLSFPLSQTFKSLVTLVFCTNEILSGKTFLRQVSLVYPLGLLCVFLEVLCV
ncbi:hypothetical protein Hanom_Chr17g01574621 [Helianthus anomalus]